MTLKEPKNKSKKSRESITNRRKGNKSLSKIKRFYNSYDFVINLYQLYQFLINIYNKRIFRKLIPIHINRIYKSKAKCQL